MKDPFEQFHHYIEALLEGRRPRRFRLDDRADLSALQAAARLAAERPAADEAPAPEFVARLGARLGAGDAAHPTATGRRSFLAAALAGLAAGLGAGFSIGRGSGSAPAAAPANAGAPAPAAPPAGAVPLVRNNGRWFPVGTLSDLAERGAIRFTAGALEGHLVKHQDQVSALSAICSHLPCTLVWRPGPDDFLCPCHDVAFSKAGEAANTQRPLPPLTKLDVKVENGEVFVWSVYIRGAKTGEPKVADPYASG